METIARAVHHIHQSGQLHLDLKPSNILLDGDAGAAWNAMIPKVSDFGIARSAEPGTTDTGPAGPGGTPSYMAPEQISKPRKEMSAAADIHGLGAILYHMLTGQATISGADGPRNPRPGAKAGPRSATPVQFVDPARPGDDLPEMPAQGPGQALFLGGIARRRLTPLARRPADLCAAGLSG